MAKVIFRDNPLSNKELISIDFKEDVNATELIDFLKIKHLPLFCKVNGVVPEIINDDFVFYGKDIVEISPILEGGGGDGGKSGVATLLTIAVTVAAIAVSGGALAGVGLAAGSIGAAVAGAAVAIGGNLLINSLFPADVQGNIVDGSSSLADSLVDTSIGNSRNSNPFGKPLCLAMGNDMRVSPPFGSQPYSTLVPYLNDVTRYQQVWQVNDTGEPCAQVCYRYVNTWAELVEDYFDGTINPNANSSYPYISGQGIFLPPRSPSGDASGYPYNISFMVASEKITNSTLFLYYNKLLDENIFIYSSASLRNFNNFNNFGIDFGFANCANGNYLNSIGFPGEWYRLTGGAPLSGNASSGSRDIPVVPMETVTNKSNTNPSGEGLDGFDGFRHKPWVLLSDPADPNQGTFISLELGNAFGWDPVAIQAAPYSDQKIDANATYNTSGEITSTDPFCIAQAEFCILESITEDKNTNRVHQIFNLGYGDLKISDSQFGTTSTGALQAIDENFNDKSSIDWPMPFDSCARERVDITEGSILPNNDLASGPNEVVLFNNFDKLNWIERCGVTKTNEIVIEIFANLYRTSTIYGILPHSEIIQIHYRPFNSNDDWLPLGNATGVHTLTGYDTFPVKEEFSSGIVDADKYCVRVRRLTLEDRSSAITANINFTSVKWFQEDCKAVTKDNVTTYTTYKAQNRIATCVSAGTSQSGILDKYNVKVSNNLWMFDIDEFKSSGVKNWVWDCEAGSTKNNNPAFQFLYFLRGGYCNSSADPSVSPSTSPLDGGFTDYGWVNGNSDAYNNEDLLWGGGVSEKRIDIDAICEWACFCHDNDFCFDYYLCSDKSVGEVLSLIARAGRATWGLSNGKFIPIWEEQDQPVVTIFSEENILEGSFQVCYNSRSEYDRVTVTYTANNEELDETQTVVDEDSFDGKPVQVTSLVPFSKTRGNEKRVELVGVSKKKQALREANVLAGKEFYQKRIYTWDTNIEHLCVNRGDIVLLSSDLTQPSFSARVMRFESKEGLITNLYLTRSMEKPITNIKIRLVCGDVVDAEVIKVNDKQLQLLTEIQALKFPIIIDQEGTCNSYNLSDETYGTYPEDIILIGSPLDTPGKRVRITNIDVNDISKATITAVDEDPAIYAYEFDCCPDPVNLEDEGVVPFVCAKVKDLSIEDCGNGKIRVSYSTEGAYAVQATYSLNGGSLVNVMSGGQYTILNDSFELSLTSGDNISIKVMPFVVGEPYTSEDACIDYVVK